MKTEKAVNFIKSKKGIAAVSILLTGIIVVSAVALSGDGGEEITYRETSVQYGDLVVGITESGSVDIGTVSQVFELDMSALQRAETGSSQGSGSSSSGGAGGMGTVMGGAMGGAAGSSGSGGMNMFSQIFNMASGDNTSSQGEASSLTVSEVCVSVGQQVQEGDVLYRLEEESVTELQEELQANVAKAKADLEAVYADQVLSKQTAQYTYDSSVAYGNYAEMEYSTTIQQLQDAVAEKESYLARAQASLADYEEQLAQAKEDAAAAQQVLENAEWSRDNVDKEQDTYLYAVNFQTAKSAQSNADTLEQKVEQLENRVEQAQENVDTCTQELGEAKRALAQGMLSAAETKQLRELAYNTAQETYDIAMAYLEDDAAAQEEIYAEAQEKWEEFSSHITDNAVCAKYNGVITSVDLEVGDSIYTNDTLVTLYDMEEVSVTVTVDEDDMTDIAEGSAANIAFTAYPDTVFQAEVTEISDAETDSSGSVTYEVTATLSGDVSGLFQGMTGEITFITKESEKVLYVSNRAIIREGTKSYVKIKDEDGKIQRKEVTTGFSDGVNVEIIEGLSEGDVVLIESKVSE